MIGAETWTAHPRAIVLLADCAVREPRWGSIRETDGHSISEVGGYSNCDARVRELARVRKQWVHDTAGYDWNYPGTPDQMRRWYALFDAQPTVTQAIDDARLAADRRQAA